MPSGYLARTTAAGLAVLAVTLSAPPAAADQAVCRYTYGGESHDLVAQPVASPYGVPAIAVGSYFKFRVVFQKTPADLASVKVYVYADREEGAAPLHEAVYAYPPPKGTRHARFGFTGHHFVYEPVRDGELEYWCRMEDKGR